MNLATLFRTPPDHIALDVINRGTGLWIPDANNLPESYSGSN